MSFLHPHFLWLLILPLAVFIWQLRSGAAAANGSRWGAALLRFLALSLLVIALARPLQTPAESQADVVAVVDCSPSMGQAAIEQALMEVRGMAEEVGTEHLRLVVFGEQAQELSLANEIPAAVQLIDLVASKPGSAAGEALALAASLCSDDGHGSIHLFSDGRETSGDMNIAAARLGRRGLELQVHASGLTAPESALVIGLHGPESAAVGEAVTLLTTIESAGPTSVTLRVLDSAGAELEASPVSLRAGLQDIAVEIRPKQAGMQRYQVAIAGATSEQSTTVLVRRSKIGVVESAPATPAAKLLRALLGERAEIISVAPADLATGVGDVDTLVLADTPLSEIPIAGRQKLQTWVGNGGGLLLSGGRNAFGPGGYSGSDFAAMLPLRFPQKKEVRDPSTALAVIIDTSGSMGDEGVSLAQEVARLALKRLKPHDKAGIVEFFASKRWAAPMQSAANSIAIQRALNRLSSGGATVMLPAVEEAYYGLKNVRTRTKHILIITDGGVEDGAFEELLRRMADDGIHVSTVLVGPRAGSSFLSRLASWGGGQSYTAPSRFQIPEVIVKQPSSSLLDPYVESASALQPVLSSRLTRDLSFDDAPELQGYVKTEAKDTAELLLQSAQGDPVLARWHYGLGRVAVLTTQLGGGWAEDFLTWPSAPDLMADLTRQLAAGQARQAVALTLAHENGGVDVTIQTRTPIPGLAASPLTVALKDADGKLLDQHLVAPVQAHVWSTQFDAAPSGDLLVEVMDPAGEERLADGAVFIAEPTEFTRLAPDPQVLAQIEETARAFAAQAAAPELPLRIRERWPLCAALALVCFLLMILVRRLPLNPRAASPAS